MTPGPADPIIGAVYRSRLGGDRFVVVAFDEEFVWTRRADWPKRQLAKLLGKKGGYLSSRREFAEDAIREQGDDGIPFDPATPSYRVNP